MHTSLHPNYHHQTVYVKFDLQIHFSPLYSQEAWHCKDANTELIKRAIQKFNWQKTYSYTSINEKEFIFINTLLSVLSNFTPHETIVCNDKDPSWFNKKILNLFFPNPTILYHLKT